MSSKYAALKQECYEANIGTERLEISGIYFWKRECRGQGKWCFCHQT